ncbi:MAG: SDR family NAD(P)-dependent oxidoreductase [Bacteroidetes bacterium]|nr:SDR family NAD(P)-dependent oxidoreductase [Bacteroidota bacterium]
MSKSVLITGASGNLGSAVTQKLLSEGYKIFTTIVPNEQTPADERIHAKVVDLFDEHDCAVYVEEITESGDDIQAGILLVGGFAMGSIAETNIGAMDKMIRLNFYTAFSMAKPLFEYFEKKGGGQIILIGARPALKPKQGKQAVAYALSKSLIFHLADLINEAGKDKNICASVVVPSTIDTTANRQSIPDADFTKWVPAGSIADTISFLLTDSGSMLRETVVKVYNKA